MELLRRILGEPGFRQLDQDSVAGIKWRGDKLASKAVLRAEYERFYRLIGQALQTGPCKSGDVIEIGSGEGFIHHIIPEVIRTDVRQLQGIDRVIDAQNLPFAEQSLRGIVGLNVFHHLPQPDRFLESAAKCLKPGARIVLIEPYVSVWAGCLYRLFHHESYDPRGKRSQESNLSPMDRRANNALPWIWMVRDWSQVALEHSAWHAPQIFPHTFLSFAVTGGFSYLPLVPRGLHRLLMNCEVKFVQRFPALATMMTIVLQRR